MRLEDSCCLLASPELARPVQVAPQRTMFFPVETLWAPARGKLAPYPPAQAHSALQQQWPQLGASLHPFPAAPRAPVVVAEGAAAGAACAAAARSAAHIDSGLNLGTTSSSKSASSTRLCSLPNPLSLPTALCEHSVAL